MKSVKTGLIAWGIMAAILTVGFTTIRHSANHSGQGFAVVELFTSEGCSSCPPADALVAKIEKESDGKPVYILAYHVDYWDRLGWKDAFSNPQYSARQRKYASWLHLQSVYTPQAIVNGYTEFVGSEENTLRKAIQDGEQKTSASGITIDHIKANSNKIELQYHTENPASQADLQLALVQKHAVTDVKRGENGGRTLSHVQIVKVLQSVSLNGKTSGSASIAAPQGFTPDGYELIAFVQNSSNGQIIAATKTPLTENLNAANAR